MLKHIRIQAVGTGWNCHSRPIDFAGSSMGIFCCNLASRINFSAVVQF
jgi:hypothetical protein